MFHRSLLIVIVVCTLWGCDQTTMKTADTILFGGTIATFNNTLGDVEAIALADGKVLVAGTRDEVFARQDSATRIIDLGGRMAMPGLIEGHGHYLMLGYQQLNVDLLDTRSYDEVISLVADRCATTPKGQWIEGRGWHQEKWGDIPFLSVDGFPTHEALTRMTPDHPVLLEHASGHAILANAKAMELAGITDQTDAPSGGRIVRDQYGKATGVFEENADQLIKGALNRWKDSLPAEQQEAQFREAALLAAQACHRYGITSFHDAASDLLQTDRLLRMEAEGLLQVRLYLFLFEPWQTLQPVLSAYRKVDPEGYVTIRAIKQFYDGALGSRGALLTEPYSDMPGHYGLITLDTNEFHEIAEAAIREGFQLNTHAIGDSANQRVLNTYEQVFSTHNGDAPRWRIEHAQHLIPTDIPRFAQLGIIASMQSIHCISDAIFVPERLGDTRAAQGAYLWRTLIDSGAVVMEGTDVPVERIDPFANIFAAITRLPATGGPAFYPAQCKTLEEALQAYVYWNAYGAFEEEYKGSLAPGKLADIAIFDSDIRQSTPDQLPGTTAYMTLVGGQIVYQRP